MTRKQLIHELKLLACGAAGADIPSLSSLVTREFFQMLRAVGKIYFKGEDPSRVCVGIAHCESFDTLADAILAEQKRLRAAKRKG